MPSHPDGNLYGRGASDMKTSIAAFTVAGIFEAGIQAGQGEIFTNDRLDTKEIKC